MRQLADIFVGEAGARVHMSIAWGLALRLPRWHTFDGTQSLVAPDWAGGTHFSAPPSVPPPAPRSRRRRTE